MLACLYRLVDAQRGAAYVPRVAGFGVSQWGQDYFISNQDELEERQKADLEPELELLPSDGPREASASIEKLFWGTTAVKIDAEGRLYVVDSCRHRIQVYHKTA